MKEKIKSNVSVLKLIPIVRKAMAERKWEEDARLSEASGVSPGIISKFLNKGKVNAENLTKILISLDLLNIGNENVVSLHCICHGWNDDYKKAAFQVKKILDSHDETVVPALKSNLTAFESFVNKISQLNDMQGEINALKKAFEVLTKPETTPDTGGGGSGIGKPPKKT